MIAQPVVSAHVRSLEDRLGVKVFDRRGRQVRLTEAGNVVLVWAEHILTRTREVERDIEGLSDGASGSVAVVASMTAAAYLLPQIFIDFKLRLNDANIILNSAEPENVLSATEAGQYDFGVVMVDTIDSRKPLICEKLRDEEIVLTSSPSYRLAPASIEAAQLGELAFVCSPPERGRRQMIDRILANHGVGERDVVLAFGHSEAIKIGVAEGLGVALLYRSAIASELADGRLKEIRITDGPLTTPVMLVHHKDKRFSPLQENLRSAIVERVSSGA